MVIVPALAGADAQIAERGCVLVGRGEVNLDRFAAPFAVDGFGDRNIERFAALDARAGGEVGMPDNARRLFLSRATHDNQSSKRHCSPFPSGSLRCFVCSASAFPNPAAQNHRERTGPGDHDKARCSRATARGRPQKGRGGRGYQAHRRQRRRSVIRCLLAAVRLVHPSFLALVNRYVVCTQTRRRET